MANNNNSTKKRSKSKNDMMSTSNMCCMILMVILIIVLVKSIRDEKKRNRNNNNNEGFYNGNEPVVNNNEFHPNDGPFISIPTPAPISDTMKEVKGNDADPTVRSGPGRKPTRVGEKLMVESSEARVSEGTGGIP